MGNYSVTVKGYNRTNRIGSGGSYFPLPIPIDAIPNNARVACRIRTSSTDVTTVLIAVTYLSKSPFVGVLLTTAVPTKVFPAAANMPTANTGAGGYVNSTWTQVVASLSTDIVIVGLVLASDGAQQPEFDLGVGAALSETVVTTIPVQIRTGTAGFPHYYALPNPLDKYVSGNRLSFRVRSDQAALTVYLGVIYHEKPL